MQANYESGKCWIEGGKFFIVFGRVLSAQTFKNVLKKSMLIACEKYFPNKTMKLFLPEVFNCTLGLSLLWEYWTWW